MKRLVCIILSMVILFSVSAFAVSAEDEMTNTNCIYFQVPTEPSVAWHNFSQVFCHIWSEGNDGADFYPWQSKNERCTDLGNGYWSYDISELDFKEDATYALIFSNENGLQTYNLTLTSACKGDIVVCDGDTCVNPVDSAKQCTVARWINNKDSVFPCSAVDSEGGMVDPDGVADKDIDRTFKNDEGTSIAMPEIEIATEAEEADSVDDVDVIEYESDSKEFPLWIIFAGAGVLVIAVVGVILAIALKKKNS